jgi:5-formyltetrahydrofolate cyclo-ligase
MLREIIRRKREQLDLKSIRAKSSVIAKKASSMMEVSSAKTILAYIPIKNEVDTFPLISLLNGKRIAAPSIIRGGIAPKYLAAMKFRRGKFGVPEPLGGRVPLGKIDIVIVPGVCFDLHGGRIGYGKGFYDKFLKKVPKAISIALAYDFQIVSHFVKEPHDALVDFIVSEKRIIDCEEMRDRKGKY